MRSPAPRRLPSSGMFLIRILTSHERGHRVSKESVFLETAAVGVTAPPEQMALAIGRDVAPMPHGASALRGKKLDAEQSQPLPAGGSVEGGREGLGEGGRESEREIETRRERREWAAMEGPPNRRS